MFEVLGIDHAVFRVKHLARMEAFYRDALGCEVVKRGDDLGLVHIRAGRCLVDLFSVDGKLGREGGGLSLHLRDPEGNILELKGPSTP